MVIDWPFRPSHSFQSDQLASPLIELHCLHYTVCGSVSMLQPEEMADSLSYVQIQLAWLMKVINRGRGCEHTASQTRM